MNEINGTHGRVRYLDGWRGCAILSVLIGHFLDPPAINVARVGVELFFVLSGRLMAQILFDRQTPVALFLARRFSRVYPALFIFVMIVTISDLDVATMAQTAASLTFTLNYLHPYVGGTPALGHIWSLCIEEHIYMLLAILAVLHRKFGFHAHVVLTVLAVFMMANGVLQTAAGGDYYEVYWRTDTRGASILCGAVAYLILEKRTKTIHPLTPVFLGVVGVALNYNHVPDPLKYTLGTSLLAGSLALLPHTYRNVQAILETRAMMIVGLTSFSLYLWQQPFYIAHSQGNLALLPAILCAIVSAVLSYRLVEKPTRRTLNAKIDKLVDGDQSIGGQRDATSRDTLESADVSVL